MEKRKSKKTLMKKIFSALFLLLAGLSASAQSMTVNDVIVVPGKSSVVAIKFADTSKLLASGFSMTLPEGITVDTEKAMSTNLDATVVTDLNNLTDETFQSNYAILVGATQTDGTYKVACISNVLATAEAPIVYVPIKADASLTQGTTLEASVTKIDLSTEGHVAASLDDQAYNALPRALGDLNGDLSVDGQDASVLYDDILNGTIRQNNPILPDVNEDGEIDGQDASTIYKIILGE